MSDEQQLIAAEGLDELRAAVEPDDHKEPCPECGERFMPGPGMGVHRKAKHNVISEYSRKQGRRPCPECGKTLRAKDLSRHLANTHGVIRKVGRPPKVQALAVLPRRVQPITAEQIIEAAAEVIWPDGVPAKQLPVLLRWHHQTADFLDVVQPAEIPDHD